MGYRLTATILLFLVGLLGASETSPVRAADSFDAAVQRVASCLRDADGCDLRSILPEKGRVRLDLRRIGGDRQGSFSPGQVDAVLGGFLRRQRPTSVRVSRVREESPLFGAAQFELTLPGGSSGTVGLDMILQRDDRGWVVREIKEVRL